LLVSLQLQNCRVATLHTHSLRTSIIPILVSGAQTRYQVSGIRNRKTEETVDSSDSSDSGGSSDSSDSSGSSGSSDSSDRRQ
jgi:hypothetical protein